MDRIVVNVPSMPKPEDFGLKDEFDFRVTSDRYQAYRRAVEAWERAVKALAAESRKSD